MDIKIYVCHHKPWVTLKNDVFEPIQVGRKLARKSLPDMIGDDTGDNISYKNKEWCELTALYWIWKNTSHDYVGLMHYRRYISFNLENHHDDVINGISAKDIEKNLWNYEGCEFLLTKYPVVTSPIYNIHPIGLPHKIQSSYEHYCDEHYKKDMDLMISIVKEKFPEYYIDFLRSIYSKKCFFGNIVVMRRDIFIKYCDFIFSVLNEVEKKIDVSEYNYYQKRVFGFLAERLSNVFVENLKNKEIAIYHAPMVYVGDKDISFNSQFVQKCVINRIPYNQNILYGGIVNIVMSFNDKYSIHAQVVIDSLLSHTKNGKKIFFYIIYDDNLSNKNIEKLNNKYKQKTNLYFIYAKNTFIEKFPLNRDYISINTYYRLIIHEVLPETVKRVIYIDSDVVVCDDIINLWNIDLGGKIIGGCQDEGGVLQSRRLFGNKANNTYINAGVLLFDIEKAIEKYSNLSFYYSEVFYRNMENITLQDQDIVNIAYKNDIKIIPLNWNVTSRIYSANDLDKAYSDQEEKDARENPWIIHYTDTRKPWKFSSTHPLKKLYWFYRENGGSDYFSIYNFVSKKNTKVKIYVIKKVMHINYGETTIKVPEIIVIYAMKIASKIKGIINYIKLDRSKNS